VKVGLVNRKKNEKKRKKKNFLWKKMKILGKKGKKNIDLSEKKSQKNGNFGKKSEKTTKKKIGSKHHTLKITNVPLPF
jgi:hypothetical protein